ncbi:site-2 protease family protein [Patescibacteria group bacterium]|nr:site-2 protease family protein [Patescibacteria group bacterium]
MNILLFIVILVVLILVHEFGHFIIAKKFGIRVDEFGVGFPPKLFGKKYGETEYTFNLLPFGGFVKIFGENPDNESISGPDRARSLLNKPKWIQALVMVGGVGFNILAAWFLFSIIFAIGMPTAINPEDIGSVTDPALTIINVFPDTPAHVAGLKAGDRLLSIESDGFSVSEITSDQISEFIASHGGKEITVSYMRGGVEGIAIVIPERGIVKDEVDRAAIGISMGIVGIVRVPPHKALYQGGKLTIEMLGAVTVAIVGFLASALTLGADFSQIAGPVGIVGFVGDAAALGLIPLLLFTAFISLNLAVINLLPLPALDGGRLVFLLVETIKGSPIKPVIVNTLNVIGFALLILLMLVVTYNDIMKIFA